MKIIDTHLYETKELEKITFEFTRSRPNLDVAVKIDNGSWQPVNDSLSFVMETNSRQVDVSVTGEDGDFCKVKISGDPDGTDFSKIWIKAPVPTSNARFIFKTP